MPKMSGYVKMFKVKEEGNKLMSFCIDNEKLLEKYKIEGLRLNIQNIALNALPFSDDRYIKTKIRTYRNKVYTNFHGLNVPEHNIECESFTVISIDSLLVSDQKYLQVYLDNCPYKLQTNKWQHYLDKNLFED